MKLLLSLFILSYACALTNFDTSLDSEWLEFKLIHTKEYKRHHGVTRVIY